ncbi:MAG: dihydrodipicolinate reductase [Planktomarina sp.]|jgi:hypothetical protein|nr:hypothetical protein [Planktomarina sp.]MDT2083666.1 dihydrodipicolinate reductase [Planktomarina sp.]
MRIFYLSFLLSLMVVSAQAGERIFDRSTLLDVVSEKVLILRLFGIKLKIMEDGRIEGKAMGRDVVGDWEWQDGFFCRSMFWGERDIGYNCQEVSINNKKIKFISDRGLGASAKFLIKPNAGSN